MKSTRSLLAVLVMLLVAGCGGTGFTYTYPSQLEPAVRAAPRTPVLVAVQDQRPYVLKMEARETFAGLFRGGYGTVNHLQSVTGRPLADDIADAVANSLRKNGAKVSTVHIEPSRTEDAVRGDLVRRNPGLVLFIAVRELKPEINAASGRTTVSHDLTATVYNKGGKAAGTAVLSGKDTEDLHRYNLDREQQRIAARINERITNLLNDPAIVKALR